MKIVDDAASAEQALKSFTPKQKEIVNRIITLCLDAGETKQHGFSPFEDPEDDESIPWKELAKRLED